MKFEITILGCGSATPTLRRSPSAQYINVLERHFLVDCGEGTQIQLRRFKTKFQKINHIFISHLHGDHFFGLIGLISSMHLYGRTKPLHVFADQQLEEIIHLQLKASKSYLNFELLFHPLTFDQPTIIFEDNLVEISSFPLKHRIPCCGFLFKEKERQLRIRKDKIQEYSISMETIPKIKNGSDLVLDDGSVIPNVELTLPPDPPRSYAYCSDTSYSAQVIEAVRGVNLLYHEATFLQAMKDRAKATAHSTTVQAAEVALKAKVDRLIIGHYSARYTDTASFKAEAETIFTPVIIAEDGLAINIPLESEKNKPLF